MVKIGCLDDSFLDIFNHKQARKKANHCSKKKSKGKKIKGKNFKISKFEKPKAVGHFQNLDFCTCLNQNVLERDSSGKNG